MRARITDKETLHRISPQNLRSYVQHKGGHELYSTDSSAVWMYGDEEILIPSSTFFGDYSLRISQALSQIETIENRSQLSVFDDIVHISYDIIRVRNVSKETESGMLGLDKSAEFVLHTKEMVLAAACHAATGKNCYPSRKPQEAERFLKDVRFGKTEQGSFTLTLLSPVFPQLNGQGVLFQPDENVLEALCFENRVIPVLNSGVRSVREAAALASSDLKTEHFTNATKHGLTTNLCDAVVNMYEKLSPDFIEFGIFFSPTRVTKFSDSKTRIEPELIPIIKQASNVIKLSAPEEGVIIRGLITKLVSEEPKESGEVIVRDVLSCKPRNVTIPLDGENYKKACAAHLDKKLVEVEGVLNRSGRALSLIPLSSIGILDTSEE